MNIINYFGNKIPLLGETLTKDVFDLNQTDLKKIGISVIIPLVIGCSNNKLINYRGSNIIQVNIQTQDCDLKITYDSANNKKITELKNIKNDSSKASTILFDKLGNVYISGLYNLDENYDGTPQYQNKYASLINRVEKTEFIDVNHDGKIDGIVNGILDFTTKKAYIQIDDDGDGDWDREESTSWEPVKFFK